MGELQDLTCNRLCPGKGCRYRLPDGSCVLDVDEPMGVVEIASIMRLSRARVERDLLKAARSFVSAGIAMGVVDPWRSTATVTIDADEPGDRQHSDQRRREAGLCVQAGCSELTFGYYYCREHRKGRVRAEIERRKRLKAEKAPEEEAPRGPVRAGGVR